MAFCGAQPWLVCSLTLAVSVRDGSCLDGLWCRTVTVGADGVGQHVSDVIEMMCHCGGVVDLK